TLIGQMSDDKPGPLDVALTLLTTKRVDSLKTYASLQAVMARKTGYSFDDATTVMWLYARPKTDQLPWGQSAKRTRSPSSRR
ncbi:MAG: hypothetical protein ACRD2I_20980, partial [Vicinamibacterales bacterium]